MGLRKKKKIKKRKKKKQTKCEYVIDRG